VGRLSLVPVTKVVSFMSFASVVRPMPLMIVTIVMDFAGFKALRELRELRDLRDLRDLMRLQLHRLAVRGLRLQGLCVQAGRQRSAGPGAQGQQDDQQGEPKKAHGLNDKSLGKTVSGRCPMGR
jgi:hypothetical protein